MVLLLEGIAMCFVLLVVCVVGIANGPAGLVVLYEQDVQDRAVELGYTTRKKIRRSLVVTGISMFAPVLLFVPAMVYGINGARGFWNGFWQMTAILWIMGLFDRLFIDWFWVERTKAWEIPGTQDLKPYIPARTKAVKWAFTLAGFPAMAALLALLAGLL